jgi:hypothetical protein
MTSKSVSGCSPHLGANALQPAVTLATKLIDLTIQNPNHVKRFVDRRPELAPFALPSVDPFNLCGPAPHLGVNLLAELALLSDGNRLHDKLHATCFTNPVLLGAVLAEVTPFPVTTHEPVLIEEAHVSRVGDV